ncbi:MAG: heat-inducible transcriptional repressor HrcA [Oscillospiraceae bacterium]|nr:heat-inducible transcriptional repressor HrcA [Oscillospiraceae bacterium]
MNISNRKRLILQTIIALHIDSGDPVGSKILNQFLDSLSVSSATLRNEMAEMTEMGLLEQPHTSAGRVPTVEGYRYYVDNLMRPAPVTDDERAYIRDAVAAMDSDPDNAAAEAAKTLSQLMDLVSITTTPAGGNVQITHYEVMKTGRYNLAVMGVSSIGGVKSRVCRTARELSDAQIAAVEAVLNDHMVFVSQEDVTPERIALVNAFLGADARICAPAISAAAAIIKSAGEVHVYCDGQDKLLAYPELDGHIRQLLGLFSDLDSLRRWLNYPEPMKIIVGDETGTFGMGDLSLVVGRYRAAGGRYGALSVAGPVRMNYGFIVPRLKYFCDYISDALTNPA